jgi:hypothetical protein
MIRAFLAPLLLVACATGIAVPPPKPATRAGGLGAIAIDPRALRPGEHLRARAEVLGLDVGHLDVSVRAACAPAATRAVPAGATPVPPSPTQPSVITQDTQRPKLTIEAKLSTAGMLRFFNKTHGNAVTEVDGTTFRAISNHTHIDDGEEWRDYVVLYRHGSYRYTYTRSDGEKKHATKPSPEEEPIFDTQNAVSLLRSWHPERVGEKSYFYIVIGRQLWRADVAYRGPTAIDVSGKSTQTLQFGGKAHRVDLHPGEEYTPKEFAVWLTDTPERLPVQVSGDGSLGTITFYLLSHDLDAPCIELPVTTPVAAATKPPATSEAVATAKAKKARKKRKRKPASGSEATKPPPLTSDPIWTSDPTGTAPAVD